MSKLIPEKSRRTVTTIVRQTSAAVVLEDALSILNNEIQRYRVKSSQGFGLDPEEAKILRTYIQSLVDLSKEQRNQEMHDGLQESMNKMTDAELLQLYQEKLEDSKKP